MRLERNSHRFLGAFSTFGEAEKHVPKQSKRGFERPNLPQRLNEGLPDRDAEVVRILSGLISETKTLFDLGGSVGVSFHQYRSHIPYPDDFRWTVCDVPYVVQIGQKLAEERHETQLAFTDCRVDADGTDVYLTCGTLQYVKEPFADILAALKDKPRHVLINRVPLTEGAAFVTLQNMGFAINPYKIDNVTDFVSSIEALGYRKEEHWKNDRYCEILLRPDRRVRNYHGFYFRKK